MVVMDVGDQDGVKLGEPAELERRRAPQVQHPAAKERIREESDAVEVDEDG